MDTAHVLAFCAAGLSQVFTKCKAQSLVGVGLIILFLQPGKIREDDLLTSQSRCRTLNLNPDLCEPGNHGDSITLLDHQLLEQICPPPPPHKAGNCSLPPLNISSGTLGWTFCPGNWSQTPNLNVQECNCKRKLYLQSPLQSSSLSFQFCLSHEQN